MSSNIWHRNLLNELDKENAALRNSFKEEQDQAEQHFRSNISSLANYLQLVQNDVFDRMERNEVLKEKLISYYIRNKSNVAFSLVQ